MIYADDVGYGDLSSYGAELIQTPEIDRLAQEGMRFTDHYATSSTCTPSRYSLLTGTYAFRESRAGVLPGDAPLLIDPDQPTLASVLQEAGYVTSVVGKWHLGLGDGDVDWNTAIEPGPLELGFDESFIFPATNDRVPTVYVEGHHVYGMNEADDPLRVSYGEQIGDLPTGHSHPELLRYPADEQHSGTIINGISRIGYQAGGQSAWWNDGEMALRFAERSRKFIQEHQQEPFFLYLSMHENHVPRWPHAKFRGTSGTGLRGDAIHELDWVVGQVVETLEELGLREETLIIFTSDNGPVFFDGYVDGALEEHSGHDPTGRFRGGKYIAFEGGTRLPLVVSWSGTIEPGESDAIISQVDFLATFAEIAGIEEPLSEGVAPDSRALASVLLGESDEGREQVVQQSTSGLAVRKGPWKYVEAGGGGRSGAYDKHNRGYTALNIEQLSAEEHLFNLADDPQETTNLAEDHLEKTKEMRALLDKLHESPQAMEER